jgi:hypothetical protein
MKHGKMPSGYKLGKNTFVFLTLNNFQMDTKRLFREMLEMQSR